ncbi:hypothetical protein KIN34_04285 [Cellulomonas sp. DKR-3]|uniref:Protein kinase domain-containing protein n=1 Tax=Cellulomonas fulva TaxID=2835530 RepID=A0ABS5TWM6_9CELL|nr:protein kinase family protein [Cellulomonas fulva]MBT0993502.1 hypothetical protein [Cellulomonas fulva]
MDVSEVVGRGTVLSARYRVLEPSTSEVPGAAIWRATDQILDRPVRAVVLAGERVPFALDGARRTALVADPRLARVLDVGTHDGLGFVVTEDVDGPSLADLARVTPLTADQARAVVGEAAAALEAARRRGVHHLALRPTALHVVDPGRVLVTGMGVDAAMFGVAAGDARTTSRQDAVDLVRVLYAALTGRWPAAPGSPVEAGLPAAPVVDGTPVPPGDLVPGVPNDLDTLCTVTLGPHDDGPHTPGDLVRELEPWGEIRAGARDEVASTAPDGPAGVGGAVAAAAGGATVIGVGREATAEDDMQDTGPIQVPRQSVRSVFGDDDSPGVNRPGTPPPAAPMRASAFGASATAPPVGATAAGGPRSYAPAGSSATPVQPPAAEAHPTEATGAAGLFGPVGTQEDFDSVIGGSDGQGPQRRSFDPTVLVLAVVGIGVVIGVVLAFKALFSSLDTGAPEPRPVATAASASATPAESEEPSDEPSAPESPPVSTAPPVIASAVSVDPSDDDGEHEEAVDRAFDGDTSTYWYTLTYQQPNFSGFKDAVGFVMTLEEPALVSSVTLKTGSSGGKVEVRASDESDPGGGTLLASGSFEKDVTFELDPPTETTTLTLWITELPTAADGSFRLELNEIELG